MALSERKRRLVMTIETIRRARNDVFLHRALQEGNANNMNELEIFESLVHILLDWHDEMFQKELDRRTNSVEPLFPISKENKED